MDLVGSTGTTADGSGRRHAEMHTDAGRKEDY